MNVWGAWVVRGAWLPVRTQGSELHRFGARWGSSVVVLTALLTAAPALAQNNTQPATPVAQLYGPVQLVRVVDGDTLVVESNIGPRTVRLIGVNAPELSPAEPGGREAAAYLARLMGPGMLVWLELDLGLEDIYGRLLAYVYVPDADGAWEHAGMRLTQVNLAMLEAGWARTLAIEPNVTYADLYSAAAGRAAAADRGIWGSFDDAWADKTVAEEEADAVTAGAAPPIRLHCGLLNPTAPNDVGEWVSVMLTEPMDTRGYYLYDEGSGSRFRLPAGMQPAGELKVPNPGQGVWNNSGDVIYLMLGNEVIDTWAYEKHEALSGVVVCRSGEAR